MEYLLFTFNFPFTYSLQKACQDGWRHAFFQKQTPCGNGGARREKISREIFFKTQRRRIMVSPVSGHQLRLPRR